MFTLATRFTATGGTYGARAAWELPLGPASASAPVFVDVPAAEVDVLYLDPALTGPSVQIGVTLPDRTHHIMRPGSALPWRREWTQAKLWSPLGDPDLSDLTAGGWFRFLGLTMAEAVLMLAQPATPAPFVALIAMNRAAGGAPVWFSTLNLKRIRVTVVPTDAGAAVITPPADFGLTLRPATRSLTIFDASAHSEMAELLEKQPFAAMGERVAGAYALALVNAAASDLVFTQTQTVREVEVTCPAAVAALFAAGAGLVGTGVAGAVITVEGF